MKLLMLLLDGMCKADFEAVDEKGVTVLKFNGESIFYLS